jgi:nicotinamidase-related amidase
MAEQNNAGIDGPAPGGTGLLIVDMINDMDFAGNEAMRRKAAAVAEVILGLRSAADRLKVPVVYVNDNFGQWHSERSRIVDYCARPDSPGREVVRKLTPREDDYFVIKPQFSGFYSTNLAVLLPKLKVSRLVLTGVATDMCVMFTAADAHMRDYELWVPADAVASDREDHSQWALELMQKSMGAEIAPTGALALADWVERGG